eukprot:12686335-Alexandrium_andersonii.AAC.1
MWGSERRQPDGRAPSDPCPARPLWAFRGQAAHPFLEHRWLALERRPAPYADFLEAYARSDQAGPDSAVAAADA